MLKTFINHDFEKVAQINNGKIGRLYQTSSGNKYPSVTTIVNMHKEKELQQWRARIGQEEARNITKRAGLRGTEIHNLCEQYIKLGEATPKEIDADVFTSLVPHLNQIDNIHCLETRLVSNLLQAAGTVDLICEYKNDLTVLDLKTSLKPKKIEWIDSYFMQCAAYSLMFWEATGIPVPKITVLIGVDDHDPQVFQQPTAPWVRKFKEMREEFRRINGI